MQGDTPPFNGEDRLEGEPFETKAMTAARRRRALPKTKNSAKANSPKNHPAIA
jgi:hypothetical protein